MQQEPFLLLLLLIWRHRVSPSQIIDERKKKSEKNKPNERPERAGSRGAPFHSDLLSRQAGDKSMRWGDSCRFTGSCAPGLTVKPDEKLGLSVLGAGFAELSLIARYGWSGCGASAQPNLTLLLGLATILLFCCFTLCYKSTCNTMLHATFFFLRCGWMQQPGIRQQGNSCSWLGGEIKITMLHCLCCIATVTKTPTKTKKHKKVLYLWVRSCKDVELHCLCQIAPQWSNSVTSMLQCHQRVSHTDDEAAATIKHITSQL